jgi:uncharacterized membrane protein (UPF0127 family)
LANSRPPLDGAAPVVPKVPRVTTAIVGRPVHALFALVALLALTAQGPAPAATPEPWCTHVPIPRADFSLKSGVDNHTIHAAKAPECRPLEIRTSGTTLRLAVAATEVQREHGLMNVPYVPAGQGMIFVFSDGDQPRSFWMKNTITPLDMIFVKRDGTISAVEVNVPATAPKTPDDKVARRNGVGTYVIELGAGAAGPLGLLPGSRLVIPPVEAR